MTGIISLFAFFLIVGAVIFIHELGHFLAAKLSGVVVEEFALGFGPKIFGYKYRGTKYNLRLLPLGGYVQLLGENQKDAKKIGSFWMKPFRVRVFILLAGVAMNFVLAIIASMLYLHSVDYQVPVLRLGQAYNFIGIDSEDTYTTALFITDVEAGSPADQVIETSELIIELQGQRITDKQEFLDEIKELRGQEVTLGVIDLDRTYHAQRALTLRAEEDTSSIGIGFREFYLLSYPPNVTSAFWHSINVFGYQVASLAGLIQSSFVQNDATIVTDQIASPVAIGAIVNDIIASEQYRELINLVIVINLALAFFNILPLPALDGGQVALGFIEKIRRKRFSMKTVERVNLLGFVLFMSVGLLVIAKDLVQFEVLSGIESTLKSVIGR